MNRLLPGLLLLSAAAQAQQPDTLAARRITLQLPLADSLRSPAFVLAQQPGTLTATAYPTTPPFTTIQPVLSRVAGVQVTPYSGTPGAWAAVRLRGVSHVTGYSQPLYVVDGVPVYNSDVSPEQWSQSYAFFSQRRPGYSPLREPTPFASGGNPLLDLPVENVAAVEVLKGAAATARYGLQGGNGVISITTRRGADGQPASRAPRVRYAGYGALQQVRQRYELLDAPQYAALTNLAWTNTGQQGQVVDPDELTTRGSVDWQDRLFRTAGMHAHNLSLDGYTGRTRYYVAADYLRQAGVLINSRLTRASLRANVEQQITSKLTVGLKVAGSQLDQRQPGPEPDASSLVQRALQDQPLGPIYDQGLPLFANVELLATADYRSPRTRRLLAQLSASYQLRPDLNLSVRGSREAATIREVYRFGSTRYAGTPRASGQTETSRTDVGSWVADAALRYQHTFGTRHALKAAATYARQQFDQHWTNEWLYDGGPGGSFGGASYEYRVKGAALHSPAFTASYVFDRRYEVQASLRADRLHAQPGQDTTFWFPGAQLSWHLGQEAFMAGVPGLHALSLYAGAGRTSGSLPALQQATPAGLSRTTQLDAGIESAWLGGRLTVAASVYQRRTAHAPTQLQIFVFAPSGLQSFWVLPDVALRNRGAELTVGSSWQWGPVAGASAVAAAANFTRVESLALFDFRGQRTEQESIPGFGLTVGQPLGGYFAYQQDGVYPSGPQAGQIRYRDVNQDGQLTPADARWQGSGLPRYLLNLTQQLAYQRLQLEVQLDGLFGYQIENPTLTNLSLPNGRGNKSQAALDYWTPTNLGTSIPQPSFNQLPNQTGSGRLSSGDHLRLTQLTLSYAVLRTARRQVSVWVGGQNLLVTGRYGGYDPNVAGGGASPLAAGQDLAGYPVARAWQLGVRGQF